MEAQESVSHVHYIVFHSPNPRDMVFEVGPRGSIMQSDTEGFLRPTCSEPTRAAQLPPEERIKLPHITELDTLQDRIPRRRQDPEPRMEFAGDELPSNDEFPGPVLIPLWRRLPPT
jgi:hypothetical protein